MPVFTMINIATAYLSTFSRVAAYNNSRSFLQRRYKRDRVFSKMRIIMEAKRAIILIRIDGCP